MSYRYVLVLYMHESLKFNVKRDLFVIVRKIEILNKNFIRFVPCTPCNVRVKEPFDERHAKFEGLDPFLFILRVMPCLVEEVS